MSDYIIKVENLSKSYQIKHQNAERYTALRDVITNGVKNLGGHLLGRSNGHGPTQETFWALKDVSFEVQPGERVGIIGRNGAGKSTLLKILSRITEPTEGRVRLRGRVASLLEVGTGFHPELSGRENIYLNGAILGMTRQEIKRKFDEIVDFSGVEKFIDTPVKRYSSGMKVRLAFAVAAHLEPEILVVDEVLAVGDAAFQKKCLGKMEDVASEGRTVLFVSHNMGTITRLCQNAVWLDKGQICMSGTSQSIVSQYLTSDTNTLGERLWPSGIANSGTNEFKIKAVRVKNCQGNVTTSLNAKEPITIEIEYEISEDLPNCRVGIVVSTIDGTVVFVAYDADTDKFAGTKPRGQFMLKCLIPGCLLNPGRFVLSISAGMRGIKNLANLESIITFDIEETRDIRARNGRMRKGIIRPQLEWEQICL